MKFIIFFAIIYSIPSNAQNKDSLELINFLKNDSIETNLFISAPDSSLNLAVANYNLFTLTHAMEAYKWQLLSAKIIFFVSILIVIMGLYLSYLQFQSSRTDNERKGERMKKKIVGKDSEVDKNDSPSVTSFHIGKEGIKIDSAVIGLVILVVSIAFFFMYLNFAFHINHFVK
jgi:hypothetical protein